MHNEIIKQLQQKQLVKNEFNLSLYHYCQAEEALQKGEDFLALHHAKKALDLGMACDDLFEAARSNLRMEKNLALELLNKGEIGNSLKALGFAAALTTGAYHYQEPQQSKPIEQVKPVIPQISKEQIVKDKTLRAISSVESGNNPDAKHHLMSVGLNKGTRALGSYGLMPLTIKETIKKDPELNKRYGHIVGLNGELFNAVVKDEPQLEHKVASKLYDNLAQKFGHHPERIGHAWFNGVSGTVNALKQGKDLNRHWHVKKIMKEYVK